MKILSLSANYRGYACSVGVNIKHKYYNDSFEANLFDLLVCSLKSINQMFHYNIENLELVENFDIPPWKNTDESEFYFKNFDNIISTHLLPKIYTPKQLKEMIKKYKRRYYRFFNNIKNEYQIFFIRWGLEKEEEILEFIKNVKEYNPKLKFCLIVLYYDKKHKYSWRLRRNKHFKAFNYYNLENKKLVYSLDTYIKLLEYDWNPIFSFINKKSN